MTQPKLKVDSRVSRASGLSAEELKPYWKASTLLRETYKKVLTSELESLIIRAEGEEICSDVAKLAHLAGQRTAIRATLKLFEDIEQQPNS